ncbi:MAG: aminotransferase class III-fold pyridoxal phosphate-dependent enzyme, partial [Candidatus Omnitrophica bacterium]|nr:aminotransferase class III-fold pyridoxal phosphate-dependent enzyme [Candidatus Omnitrophota bacterium]
VVNELKKHLSEGTSYGAPHRLEIEFAREIRKAIPSMELIRFVNSGTEATMSAIRLARGFTGRDVVVKFGGSYHGHADYLLTGSGSGVMSLKVPNSMGVPYSILKDTVVLPYNNLKKVDEFLRLRHKEVACIIVEPIAANMGVVPAREDFIRGLRKLSAHYGIVLIFDEVITGFRLSYSGAQGYFGIKPDLTCLGKIIGAGLPIGAYGGRRDIMKLVAPLGGVYQAGTLSGNPVAIRAGLSTLKQIKKVQRFYYILDEKTTYLSEQIKLLAKKINVIIRINKISSMFTIFFTNQDINDHSSAKKTDTSLYSRFFHQMLKRGIYLAPSNFEANFLSMAHTDKDIEDTLRACAYAFKSLKG